jgi:transposase-like protein
MELQTNHGEERMDRRKDTAVEAILEQLIEQGPGDLAGVFARAFELAMQIERERFLGAGHYERTPERRGYANGTKPKRIDTPAGTVNVQVPKTAGHDGEPFYPQSLERGRRSVRAVMLAVAEMYIKGVSTREVEAVMREFGIESLSSSQVSRAAKQLDEDLAAWRDRPLGEIKYLILDARYEKMRHGGIVRDVAVLSAIGIGPDERRRVLGVSVALSEAEVHWRAFLESLVARGMRGVDFIVSDDHSGLRAARRAVLGGATWQRCQFHLARNAIHHAPNAETRKRIGRQLKSIWTADDLNKAETASTPPGHPVGGIASSLGAQDTVRPHAHRDGPASTGFSRSNPGNLPLRSGTARFRDGRTPPLPTGLHKAQRYARERRSSGAETVGSCPRNARKLVMP